MRISVRDVFACDRHRSSVAGGTDGDVGPAPQLVLPILRRITWLVAAFGCEVSALRVSEREITDQGDYGQIAVEKSPLHE
jgi:hypothetical protein